MQQSNRRPIFKAMDYISQNLHLNPTLEEIANAVALSSFHFHRLFRAQVGETVAAFTRRLRMERAAAWLLAFPQEEITGLALRIGFSSSQNFAKAFRAHFAVSPGEFRRRHILATKSKPGNVVVEKSPYSHFTAPSIGLLAAHISRLPARRVAYMRRFGPYGKRDLPTNASGSAGLVACTHAIAARGDSLRVLGCAGDNLCCTLPNGRRESK
ncbi:DNA-binding transcriptional regulator AraC [Kluyvera cryocrescens]|uniref:DNA-binding transcriptional regulator AraC n=1 Tax=Kluyvera cryocrescens TaxID=580 RepID=A0A485BTH8_KLUCR|nr:DNA-binding transcriptional regulator AraC [Kluyvera cryocrescens]